MVYFSVICKFGNLISVSFCPYPSEYFIRDSFPQNDDSIGTLNHLGT